MTGLETTFAGAGRDVLKGKVVVVTGASAGIGRATAVLLARHGARVVAAARRADRVQALCTVIVGAGGDCFAVPTDVAERDQVQRLADATVERFGRVDVWINNAGFGLVGTLEQTTPEEMERLWRVNYMGAFHGCQIAVSQMRRQGGGHIINVASLAARFPLPLSAGYTATKAAMTALSDSLAAELEGSGILVSAILPGLTETEFSEAAIRKLPDEQVRGPRAATANEVAAAILRCIRRPRRDVMLIPAPALVLALFDLFPGLWRFIARRYIAARTGGRGTPAP